MKKSLFRGEVAGRLSRAQGDLAVPGKEVGPRLEGPGELEEILKRSDTDSEAVRLPLGVKLPEAQPRTKPTNELHDRDPLVSYFGDIGGIPTLQREHEIILAKEIESATHEFRLAILSRLAGETGSSPRFWWLK